MVSLTSPHSVILRGPCGCDALLTHTTVENTTIIIIIITTHIGIVRDDTERDACMAMLRRKHSLELDTCCSVEEEGKNV